MISLARLVVHLLPLGLLATSAAAQDAPLDARLHEQIVTIPAGPGAHARMEVTLFRPDGPGPFPLLVINHGKQQGDPHAQPRERFFFMASAFVRRGYAVMLPTRQGFGNSGGAYLDFGCDMSAHGYAQAKDVIDALSYARTLPWIDAEHIVVAGQSYGGLATVALGTYALRGVRGLLNFAGGLRDDAGVCNWQDALVQAFADFGAHSKIPSLWMYGANDSYFGPPLVARMHQAFVRAGGRARLVAFGTFKRDAHTMLESRDGPPVWLPETERFLRTIGMPTRELYSLAEPPALPGTGFARLDDSAAVPFVDAGGRAAYQDFLGKITPRAFAVSASGVWSWAEDGENPVQRALLSCQQASRRPCRVYAIDDKVVWQDTHQRQASKAPDTGHL